MKKIYIFLAIFLVLFFLIFYYKKSKLGNTIIKLSEEKIIENILNSNINYKAKLKVKVFSNKNENEYEIKILENKDDSLLEAIGKSEVSGLKIENKNGDLIVSNTNLKLDKIYEKYKEITDNSLFLRTFIEDYRKAEKRKIFIEEENLVIKIVLKNYTKYIKYKELYLDQSTGKPVKMIIKDSNNNVKNCIEYISIEIL